MRNSPPCRRSTSKRDEHEAEQQHRSGDQQGQPVGVAGGRNLARGRECVTHGLSARTVEKAATPGCQRHPERDRQPAVGCLLDRAGRVGSPLGHRAVIHGGVGVATDLMQGEPGDRGPMPGVAEDDVLFVRRQGRRSASAPQPSRAGQSSHTRRCRTWSAAGSARPGWCLRCARPGSWTGRDTAPRDGHRSAWYRRPARPPHRPWWRAAAAGFRRGTSTATGVTGSATRSPPSASYWRQPPSRIETSSWPRYLKVQ